MNYKTFWGMSLSELERLTGITRFEWSRYFNDHKKMTETTLDKAAEGLCVESPELLRFIKKRREETLASAATFSERKSLLKQ